jgi:hypothetical protein
MSFNCKLQYKTHTAGVQGSHNFEIQRLLPNFPRFVVPFSGFRAAEIPLE